MWAAYPNLFGHSTKSAVYYDHFWDVKNVMKIHLPLINNYNDWKKVANLWLEKKKWRNRIDRNTENIHVSSPKSWKIKELQQILAQEKLKKFCN